MRIPPYQQKTEGQLKLNKAKFGKSLMDDLKHIFDLFYSTILFYYYTNFPSKF